MVPKQLRPVLGKVELKWSLGTKDCREEKVRALDVEARFDAVLAHARNSSPTATGREINGLGNEWCGRERARYGDNIFARLLTFPNVLVSRHQGFFTVKAMAAIAETTMASITSFEATGPALHEIVAHGSR